MYGPVASNAAYWLTASSSPLLSAPSKVHYRNQLKPTAAKGHLGAPRADVCWCCRLAYLLSAAAKLPCFSHCPTDTRFAIVQLGMVQVIVPLHSQPGFLTSPTSLFWLLHLMEASLLIKVAIDANALPNPTTCSLQLEVIRVNVLGMLNLADICLEKKIHLTTYATGCIFHYDKDFPQGSGKGFTEEDEPNFTGSYYSKTKVRRCSPWATVCLPWA